MPLTVHALTTLQAVKDELGIMDSSKDSVLERLINAASEAIEQYCGRHFEYEQGVQETLAGTGGSRLVLSRIPVRAVTSVTVSGMPLDDYVVEDPKAGILYRGAGWPWTARAWAGFISQDPLIGTESRDIVVTYDAGFVTPQQEADSGGTLTRDLPHAVEEACILTVVTWYLNRGENLSITSEGLAGVWVRYDRSVLPQPARELLAPYKRLVMA